MMLMLCFICALALQASTPLSPMEQPVQVAWVPESESLWTVTKNTHRVLRINPDTHTHTVIFQTESPLHDLRRIPGTDTLAALQRNPGRLYLFKDIQESTTPRIAAINVPPDAHRLQTSPDGRYLYVLHHWTHQATILERRKPLTDGHQAAPYEIKTTIPLPYAPGRQLIIADKNTWIITAAYGGRMSLLDAITGTLRGTIERPIHNIQGLTLDPGAQTLWLTHQTLHPDATTLRGDIQWGFLMENQVSGFKVKGLANHFTHPGALQLKGKLEGPGNAAGDPAAVLWTDQGEMVVALAGVGEVAVLRNDSSQVDRLGVGRRPTALAYDSKHRRVFIANTLSDSFSVLQLAPSPRISGTIRLGPHRKRSLLAEGERLFFDAHQSFHGWFSCHSCHTDGHANGRLNDNEADGSFGAPKNIPTLLGVANTAPWSWLGKRDDLTEQVHRSIETTMREVTSPQKANALRAFMETLSPAPALRPGLTDKARKKGMQLFEHLRCDECHTPPYYTEADTFDVGLQDEKGKTHFNPPSLLGVSQRPQWFHDGRAKSLKGIFTEHHHMIDTRLSDEDLDILVRFLESL
jgi:cytochrome c peroxidase